MASESTYINEKGGVNTNNGSNGKVTSKEWLANSDKNQTSVLKRIAVVIIALLVDTGLPLVFYFILRLLMDPMWAMLLAGVPALVICIVKMVWKRQLSVMALVIFVGFVFTAILSFITDDPRLLILEKSLMLGVFGFLHALSLLPLPLFSIKINRKTCYKEAIVVKRIGVLKPFLYYNLHQMYSLGDMDPEFTDGEVIDKHAWLWKHIRIYRIHLLVLTGVTGFMLLGEFVIKCIMIFSSMSVDDVMLYSNIFFYIMMAILVLFNAVYIYFAKQTFFQHVDKWIDENYNNRKEKEMNNELSKTAVASYIVFSNAAENNGYSDPLLQV